MPAPDCGSVPAVQAGPVPAVASFEAADPSFAAGAPFDQTAEAAAVLDRLGGGRSGGLAWDSDGAHAAGVQVALDGGVAVAAVGGDGAGYPAGTAADAVDGGDQLRGVGSGAVFEGVIEDDAVVVVADLGLVPEPRPGGRCGPCGSGGRRGRAG